MKKVIFLVLIVILGINCTQLKGQDSVQNNESIVSENSNNTTTVVQKGGTVYDLSSYYYGDGENWRWVVLNNPFLQEKGRVWKDTISKKWYCKIYPGEELSFPKIPIEIEKGHTATPPPVSSKDEVDFLQGFAAMLLAILFIIFLGYLISKYQKNKMSMDPITAGPPQVPGGINDKSVEDRYRDYAYHKHPQKEIEVTDIKKGLLFGPAVVHYGDNSTKNLDLQGTPAYSGEISEVGGEKETIYFLQGCGNDARAGNFMTGNELRFIPDQIIPNTENSLSDISLEQIRREVVPEVDKFFGVISELISNDQKYKITLEHRSNEGDETKIIIEPRVQHKLH